MSTLCQIAVVDNEQNFQDHLKKYGEPLNGNGGWGRFYGDVPAIGTTSEINWRDYELINEELFPKNGEKDRDRQDDKFRIIHYHRHLVPKPEYYSSSIGIDTKRGLNTGHHSTYLCIVYVVKVS